jgi:hypothetical protein
MTQPYHELIYLEGGPDWKNDCSGRGDWGLLRPMDRVLHYPNGRSPQCEYVRTDRTWKCPFNGAIHTVFEFKRAL